MEKFINFKIIVLGAQGVGKSSLVMRYIKGEFNQQYNVTVGVEYASKIVEIDHQNSVRLQIWDSAGQEIFRSIVRSFYNGISAVFFIFAIDKASSFQQLAHWAREISESAHEEVVIFLIGARADLQDYRQVSGDEASVFLKLIRGVFYIEVSSKNNLNIDLLFKKASEILYKKYTSNGSFRNLVRPMLASGLSTKTISLNAQEVKEQQYNKPKKCC